MIHSTQRNIMVGILLVAALSFGTTYAIPGNARGDRGTFVCNKNKERETREYQKDLREQKRLGDIQTRLLSDTNVANNTCKQLKKKAQARCHQDVAQLREVTRNLVKINQRISEYEMCYLAPKCGSAVTTPSATPPATNLCASGMVVIGVTFDVTTVDPAGNGMWTWRCGIEGSSTGETCYAPRSFTYSWMVGSWEACIDNQRTRLISCQDNLGQIVSSNYCTDRRPEPFQICLTPLVTQIQSSRFSTPVDAANLLANQGIIMDYSASPSSYRVDETMSRQEYLGIMLNAMGLMPANDYQCRNFFVDVSEPWVCRIAETALANGLIVKQYNEEGNTLFRGTSLLSLYEILVLNMKSQCIKPYDVSVSGIRAKAQNLGIINAATLNMTAIATRGDVYLSLATFNQYFSENDLTDPNLFDSTIVTCNARIGTGTVDVLCTLFPDLCL